jgi:hypothetical protein
MARSLLLRAGVAFRDRISPRAVLIAAWAIAIVYAYPGYMNYDAADQLHQLRRHELTDWHPPLQAGYWRVLELVVTGPITLLILQVTLLLWAVHAILRTRLAPRAAAWLAAALLLFPPVLTPMAVVWKDAQMAAFLAGAIALALRSSRGARIGAIAMLACAAGVRHNGGAALPALALLAATTWWARRALVRVALAAAIVVVAYVPACAIDRQLTDKRAYAWYRTTAMFDIVGIGCYAPTLSDDELRELLEDVPIHATSDLQRRFCELYPAGKRDWFAYAQLFEWEPTAHERLARKRAWTRMVTRYPGAYLHSRLVFAADLLGLIPDAWTWEPVGQDFAGTPDQLRLVSHDHTHSVVQRALGRTYRWLAEHTPLYRPYLYALASLALLAWAVRRRDLLVGCIVASGIFYELSIIAFANAPDFRYSHWMIACTCLGAALAIARRGGSAPTR